MIRKEITDNIFKKNRINNKKGSSSFNVFLLIIGLTIILIKIIYAQETAVTANVIVLGQESFSLNLHYGWNLVSIPLNPENPARDNIFPSSLVEAVWQYNNPGGYVVPNIIEPKKGYWVKAKQDTTIIIYGTKPLDDTVQINEGWNLIGVVGNQPYPTEPFVLAVWEYLPPYQVPTTLFEGRGFWVKASSSGILFSGGLASGEYYEASLGGICGNNIREGLEDCDLNDNDYCENGCNLDCICESAPEIPNIIINSPVEGRIYNTKNILLDVILKEKVKNLYYKVNNDKERRLCKDCQIYSENINFMFGDNNLTIRAVTYDNKIYTDFVFFRVNKNIVRISGLAVSSNDNIFSSVVNFFKNILGV